ncbi:uncharacterized protein PgNI_03366 [Pyricularia grisea]|uniref:FAD/NAD(P)-binding domain-containing protein n=1 Tax=Pyricularia grisea TaxID=148305 RepID=A0A6P8BCZ8_PYRGI|nr:uncharacterized protein PgNI_03366 [Pyricularia grisea]TLD13688.1 hypothetical protein PgNI_03366 [Pyricularia grisea]
MQKNFGRSSSQHTLLSSFLQPLIFCLSTLSKLVPPKMSQPKTVVVLGAAMAGVPAAQKLLTQVAPKVPGGLKVILVGPNTHVFWNLASVRGVLPGNLMPEEKLFYPIAPAFAQFSSSQFEFVVGKATTLNPETKNVLVTLSGKEGGQASERTISYDIVVVATGSSAKESMPWKIVQDIETTKTKMRDIGKDIDNAKSIVVVGGGMTGVEVAGELGQTYKGRKEITLIVKDDLPLTSDVRSDIRALIVTELKKLGVNFITSSRVTSVKDDSSTGGKTLEITSSSQNTTQTIHADVYLPTFGMEPNTEFMPAHLLDQSRRVKTNLKLRAEGHDDVYVVGDVSNLQSSSAAHLDAQVAYLIKELEARLVSGRSLSEEYKPNGGVMFAVSLGSKRGTGQMGKWKLPSIMVGFAKSRNLTTDRVPAYLKA